MTWFQLDPQSIAARARAAGKTVRVQSLWQSIARGAVGFMLVSVAGFAPWPVFDLWLRGVGEVGLYLACTAVFLGGSGLALHRLVLGPGSLWRCYALFTIGFSAYALAWVLCWMALRGDAGEIAGALCGTVAMAGIFAAAFGAPRQIPKAACALFLLHTLGYEAGERAFAALLYRRAAGMLAWGVCYGLGFGAGIGAALHFCQGKVRAALRAEPA